MEIIIPIMWNSVRRLLKDLGKKGEAWTDAEYQGTDK